MQLFRGRKKQPVIFNFNLDELRSNLFVDLNFGGGLQVQACKQLHEGPQKRNDNWLVESGKGQFEGILLHRLLLEHFNVVKFSAVEVGVGLESKQVGHAGGARLCKAVLEVKQLERVLQRVFLLLVNDIQVALDAAEKSIEVDLGSAQRVAQLAKLGVGAVKDLQAAQQVVALAHAFQLLKTSHCLSAQQGLPHVYLLYNAKELSKRIFH